MSMTARKPFPFFPFFFLTALQGLAQDIIDHIEDMQAAGASYEQAVAIVQAKHEMFRAAKAALDEVSHKVEGDLKTVGVTSKLSQALVACLKDKALEFNAKA
ncbi:MAG: hypothetical protein ACYDIC_05505 [Desulfobaccales bacterium]